MAKQETKRVPPKVHAKDLELYSALKSITRYAPVNPAYTQEKMDILHGNVLAARDVIAAAEGAIEAARDDYVAAQWDLHNGMLGAKSQVIAQFGINSNEVQAMQLKKKTEYKAPKRKTSSDEPKSSSGEDES